MDKALLDYGLAGAVISVCLVGIRMLWSYISTKDARIIDLEDRLVRTNELHIKVNERLIRALETSEQSQRESTAVMEQVRNALTGTSESVRDALSYWKTRDEVERRMRGEP